MYNAFQYFCLVFILMIIFILTSKLLNCSSFAHNGGFTPKQQWYKKKKMLFIAIIMRY